MTEHKEGRGKVRRPDRPDGCRRCGRPITQRHVGRPRLYCRQTCRQRAYERRRVEHAVAAVAAERDALHQRWWLLTDELQRLADEVTPFAYSAPDAAAPDPARLSIAVVELAQTPWVVRVSGARRTCRRGAGGGGGP